MARADRPSPEDAPDVDFVVGEPDEGPDEELPQPDAKHEHARRLTARIGAGALGLLVVVLIGRAALGSSSSPQARATTTPSPTVPHEPTPTGPVTAPPFLYKGNLPPARSTSPTTSVPGFPERIPVRHGTAPARCPGHRCSTSVALPGSVLGAILDAFPNSTILRAETVRLRGGDRVLWFREVDVRAGSERLTLRVQAPARDDRTASGHRASNGLRTAFVDTSLGPWHVEVEAVDRSGGRPPSALLSELARDPRIVSV